MNLGQAQDLTSPDFVLFIIIIISFFLFYLIKNLAMIVSVWQYDVMEFAVTVVVTCQKSWDCFPLV